MNEQGAMGIMKFVNRLGVLVLIGVIASGVAMAKSIKKQVTFSEPVVVNGSVVKAGTYQAVFDDQTNELSIVRGKKVIAKSPAKLEPGDHNHAVYVTREEGDNPTRMTLVSVTLSGGKQATLDYSNGSSAQ